MQILLVLEEQVLTKEEAVVNENFYSQLKTTNHWTEKYGDIFIYDPFSFSFFGSFSSAT